MRLKSLLLSNMLASRAITRITLLVGLCMTATLAAAEPKPTQTKASKIEFARDVRPILQSRCAKCHGPEKREAGLRLDQRAAALTGSDAGPVIVPGKSAASTLLRRVTSKDDGERMPPDGKPLTAEQVATIKAWIDQGAAWPADGANDTQANADWEKRLDHWAFRPLTQPVIPRVRDAAWPRTPLDRFILAKLESLSFRPAREADRRTLIRRLSFDLLGLPPDPDRVDAFVRDRDPQAYEKLVDELLASPHYGERWARHWLDVVHFGETHGYDKDKLRPNAWPYRDYVIRAFNRDVSYSQFVEEQIAGDVLFPGTADGIEALGFIAAGPWDFIGHAEVPETKIDGQIARHLDRDDMIGNSLGTFCSLTVQCAQCHNHKFDPITQEDYYRLQAVFAAVDRTDKAFDLDPFVARRRGELLAQQQKLLSAQTAIDQLLAKSGGRRLEILERLLAENKQLSKQPGTPPARPEFGWHSNIEAKPDVAKWVQVDLESPQAIEQVVLVGCHDTFNNIGGGFGFPLRFKVEACDDPQFAHNVTLLDDQTAADFANPGVKPRRIAVSKDRSRPVVARYVRVTATRLAPRQNDYIFALGELQATDRDGRNLALGAAVTSFDSIEAGPRWGRANLTDGYYYGRPKATPDEAAALAAERDAILARMADPALRTKREALGGESADVNAALAALPPQRVAYVGAVHQGSGAFRGTGPDGGRPRKIHILSRGDVKQPSREVDPGPIASLAKTTKLPAAFDLPTTHGEGARRAALAQWITHRDHPLTWRSIVNRAWQYHFGRGLVDTPNDFGHMGQRPSHLELLDWLAADFRDHQSLKRLHRLIVTSAVYRQDSNAEFRMRNAEFMNPQSAIRSPHLSDAANALLWRMNRRKLEAEAVRDAALSVAGLLDRRQGGPSFQDFVVEHPEHSPHFEYHKFDPTDPRAHRRSIYRFLVRSQPQPFMTTLDCADPSMRVDKRNESLAPAQALAMLNDGLMLTAARAFAERVNRDGGDTAAKIQAAYRLALARTPTAEEMAALSQLAMTHGLDNACRVILNLNEFTFVD